MSPDVLVKNIFPHLDTGKRWGGEGVDYGYGNSFSKRIRRIERESP